jgi:Anthrone oxygenase
MSVLFEVLATMCAGLFAGAALYITFVEHPARLECGTELAATEFGPSYRRATLMQASLAAIGLAAALVAWLRGRGLPSLVGGLLLGAVIPFTLIVILPTNSRLLDPGLDRSSLEAAALLGRWGRLHAVRSALGALAFGVLLWHLAGPG